ncbi:AI-2E family transporter [Anaerorhabdus sp.]|uniref:AI-2E family transporter n=1 Tax=Anaerorhabdus sp. TaxID=1872524 RepID=UPI002FCB7200
MFNQDIKKVTQWIILAGVCTVFIFILMKADTLLQVLSKIQTLLTPLVYGLGFAFIINLFSSRIERLLGKWFKDNKHMNKIKRPVAIFTTIILAVIIFYFLTISIFPQLIQSLQMFAKQLPSYIKSIEELINKTMTSLKIDYVSTFSNSDSWVKIVPQITNYLTKVLPDLYKNAMSISITFLNVFMGFMICFYFLMDKEKFILQAKKILAALLPIKVANKVLEVSSKSNHIFSMYVRGQLTECLLEGIIFIIVLTLLKFPYALLIGSMVCVLSIVPVLGATFVCIFGFLLILAINPLQAVLFVIIYQVIQQLESSLLYPRVVGNSVGLPGVLVLTSVFLCGGLFGLIGVLLGVPMTAVVYTLFREFVYYMLDRKKVIVDGNQIQHVDDVSK